MHLSYSNKSSKLNIGRILFICGSFTWYRFPLNEKEASAKVINYINTVGNWNHQPLIAILMDELLVSKSKTSFSRILLKIILRPKFGLFTHLANWRNISKLQTLIFYVAQKKPDMKWTSKIQLHYLDHIKVYEGIILLSATFQILKSIFH